MNKLRQIHVSIQVPDNAVQLKISATMIDKDLKQHQIEEILELPDIIESRISGEEIKHDFYC